MNTTPSPLPPEAALRACCDWLLDQRVSGPFFRCFSGGKQAWEWYMIFYPVRALLLAGHALGEKRYLDAAFECVDAYVSEQLPNGAFTSNFRKTPTTRLAKKDFQEILRCGKVNLADNGSNVAAIIQAAGIAEGERRRRYTEAARRWFDNWVCVWALPEGGYGNGIWVGHKLNAPYTCAMATVCTALSAFHKLTGEEEYRELAERCMRFQCAHWLEDGRPINFDCYPSPFNLAMTDGHFDAVNGMRMFRDMAFQTALTDYGHSFYLIEGMCWTHSVAADKETKALLEKRLRDWIFNPAAGLLSQWKGSWFSFQTLPTLPACPPGMPSSRMGVCLGWELAKSNGILHAFQYFLRHIEDHPELWHAVEAGLGHLGAPPRARMSGVMSDPEESYGAYAVQATGFAGLSLIEAARPNATFAVRQISAV
jgi:hypothetical protein